MGDVRGRGDAPGDGRDRPADVPSRLALLPHAGQSEAALLRAVVEAVSTGPDVEPLAAAVAALITEATTTDVCFVHVLDDTEGSLSLAGATPPCDGAVGQVHMPLGVGVTGWVAEHREAVVITEGKEQDPRYIAVPALRGPEFVSMASVPMIGDAAGLVGVLNVHTVVRRDFGDADIRLLTLIGNLVAGAVHSARLHRRVVVRERAQERFTEEFIDAQESERRRLARDIHDGISQRLVSLAYHLDAAGRALPDRPEIAAEQVRQARRLADLSTVEARTAIAGLRPPVLDDLGLAGGLTSLVRSLPEVTGTVEATEHRLRETQELALYRIAQEALQNVVKHAAAEHVWVRFGLDEQSAVLEVADNGIGFDADRPGSDGYGRHSMAERAELIGATLHLRSRVGAGTTVRVVLPVGPPHSRQTGDRLEWPE